MGGGGDGADRGVLQRCDAMHAVHAGGLRDERISTELLSMACLQACSGENAKIEVVRTYAEENRT